MLKFVKVTGIIQKSNTDQLSFLNTLEYCLTVLLNFHVITITHLFLYQLSWNQEKVCNQIQQCPTSSPKIYLGSTPVLFKIILLAINYRTILVILNNTQLTNKKK